jgi:peroxiredoxin/uncharacterized membrane protein YphA (DoxX/SURF4 family)
MDPFLVGGQLLLAAVFALAGGAKLFDLPGSRQAVTDFGAPERFARPLAVAIPLAELAAAVALIFQPSARWGAALALVLLLVFVGGVANAMRRGLRIDCGCFGKIYSATASSATLARNAILAVLAGFVVIAGPAPAIDAWFGERSLGQLLAFALVTLAIVAAVAALWLRAQTRALEADAERVTEAQQAAARGENREVQGLQVGTPAPAFDLPDVHGRRHTLESLLARGKPVVIAFMSIGCGPCGQLRPEVARWREMLADRLTFAVVSDGTVEDVRGRWDEHGVDEVLVDPDDTLMDAHRLKATPTVVLIDTDGNIASRPAGGGHGAEVLVRHALRWRPGRKPRSPRLPAIVHVEPHSA